MLPKQIPAIFGNAIGSTWLPTNKLLRNDNNLLLFQGLEVAGEIPVSQIEQLLQCIEINTFIHHKCRHDSKPDAAFKNFLKVCNWILHKKIFTV